MKCPLPISVYTIDSYPPDNVYRDCLKEECAWWIKDSGRCCILDGVLCLNILNNQLDDIHDAIDEGGKT